MANNVMKKPQFTRFYDALAEAEFLANECKVDHSITWDGMYFNVVENVRPEDGILIERVTYIGG